MLDVHAFILVGGASSRMGSDKARLELGGSSTVERLLAELGGLNAEVFLVGSRDDSSTVRLANVPDVLNQWGALGGIHAALASCRAEWALIVACDLPFVTLQLFERLLKKACEADSDAIVPIQRDGRPQPLCALYRRGPCLREAERLIDQGEHKPRQLLAAVRTRWVPFAELHDLAGSDHFFFNMNTPAEYERAREIIAALTKPEAEACSTSPDENRK